VAVVRPRFVGAMNLTHATVTYLPNEKSQRVQTGYSTEIGEVYIQRLRDYNRKFASHTVSFHFIRFKSILGTFFSSFLKSIKGRLDFVCCDGCSVDRHSVLLVVLKQEQVRENRERQEHQIKLNHQIAL
jgi:hypothetical protein